MMALGEVADVQLGKMLSQAARAGEQHPYLRNQDVQWGSINTTDLPRMGFTTAEQAKFDLRSGDILVCEGGEPGRAALWRGEQQGIYFQKALHRLRVRSDKMLAEYLYFFLLHAHSHDLFSASHTKNTIAHLPRERLVRQQIPIPPLDIQRQLVKTINAIRADSSDAICALLVQAKALEATKERLITDLFYSGEHDSVKLEQVLDQQTAGIGSGWASFPVYGATRQGLAMAKEKVGKHGSRYKPITENCIFYNPMRILLGSIATLPLGGTPGITSPDYVVVKAKRDLLNASVFYEWFRGAHGARMILDLARGAVRERILFNRLREGCIPLPPVEEQDQVAEVLQQLNGVLVNVQRQVTDLAAFERAVLREAFA